MSKKDPKRTTASKTTTLAIRTVRHNRDTEQRFTNRSFNRLLTKGL